MDHVVVDVEIANTIEQTPGGWDATDRLGVAVACVWEFRRQRMRVYGPDDVNGLRERLLKADRISGYNILRFDFPVIWGMPKITWAQGNQLYDRLYLKTDDMLRRIWEALGFNPDVYTKGMGGCKLQDIAVETLGVGKIASGEESPVWYQQGLVQRVVNYCADDVCIERDLCVFIDKFGYVIQYGHQLTIPPWRLK